MALEQQILEASKKHPKPARLFTYGTAGFRMKAELLPSVVFRVGLLASARSRKLNGQSIGVMITASHNPPEDNGVKLVDPYGDMLEASWEPYATTFANAKTDEELAEEFERLHTNLKINTSAPSRVIFARDTRASGPTLVDCLVDALKATNTEYVDYNELTTPQLHYLVRCTNTKGTQYEYGEISETGYYEKLSTAFKQSMKNAKSKGTVTVDCANGVGGPKLRELIKYLPSQAEGGVDIKVVNEDVDKPDNLNYQVLLRKLILSSPTRDSSELNYYGWQCGADFVKTQQRAPPSSKAAPGDRCASLDGDADRIVYYFVDNDLQFRLLDGDRIATLAAAFLGELGEKSGLASKLSIGVVQTAYANGSSTKFIAENLKLPIQCTPTGVKHLHHAAQRFDIGVYFEANGHGTVLFSAAAQKAIATHEPQSPSQADALATLTALTDLINQTVGDALSDLLLVEVILAHKTWELSNWASTYTDYPNRLIRVEVGDRYVFKTEDAERRLTEPKQAQARIDELVGKYTKGRSFARASGTEDAVRVYAEAATRAEADDLAQKVATVVKQFGGTAK
ncbi:MAG: Phosphoacetylglucosamine Mutase [Bathelium mastoideum]|nr:MAG: Phosphoacetylglucosamine Mutase [Bathelium mastoideum]KAI9689734.1 MAG: Phosphoacetylglucosamine Mutase [Bathelium mastoideum]